MHLFCKVCGDKIAETQMRPSGPLPNSPKVPKFTRFANYTEVKIQFDDGSFLVTNGCSKCLSMHMDKEVLRDIYIAEMDELASKARRLEPVGVVGMDRSGQGLL